MHRDDTANPRATRPNVYDVAQLAGVSIATVSRVRRGNGPVADATRERVQAAMTELDWQPSAPARALAGERHEAVGIVFPELSGRYYAEVIRGFEARAVEASAAALILAAHERPDSEAMVRDLAARVDGLIIMDRTIGDDTAAIVERRGVPVVLLARPPVDDIPAVRVENVEVTRELTAHLLTHGWRRLVFLGDPDRSPDVAQRWRGFQQAHADEGLDVPRAPLLANGYQLTDGSAAALGALDGADPPDGIVCANDELASGVYEAAELLDLAVGAELAVTGWDDQPLAERLAPPLSTVHQPMSELGARAAACLIDRIEGRHVVSETLATRVQVRHSCGC